MYSNVGLYILKSNYRIYHDKFAFAFKISYSFRVLVQECMITKNQFLYFSTKTYVVGTQKNHLMLWVLKRTVSMGRFF